VRFDNTAVCPCLAVIRSDLGRLLEVLVGLGELDLEILVGRLGVDPRQAVVDLHRLLGSARPDHRDEPAHPVGLVVVGVVRDRLGALAVGALEVVLGKRVLADIEALGALLHAVLDRRGAGRQEKDAADQANRERSSCVSTHGREPIAPTSITQHTLAIGDLSRARCTTKGA
jgi:hypothetical protein